MADLQESDVQAQAEALGLPVTPEDLTEVTHRLNALIAALRALPDRPLEDVEATPAPIDPDRG